MKSHVFIISAIILSLYHHHEVASEDSSPSPTPKRGKRVFKGKLSQSMSSYYNYLKANRMMRKYYHSQFNPKLVKGKCKPAPRWWINGTNPVMKEVKKGYAVFLFTMKRNCRRCWNELHSLHDWAKYYKNIGVKAKIIVLMHRKYGKVSAKVNKQWFPYIKIYNEPKRKNIFKKLKAGIHDILMYDKCGRHQYHYGLPYSTLVQPYVRLAMQNTLDHYITFCGPCKPLDLLYPTANTTTNEVDMVPPGERIATTMRVPEGRR